MSQNVVNSYRYAASIIPLDPVDFSVVSSWVQSPTGTVTWNSGGSNYARTDTLLASGNDWEIRFDPSASNWGAGTTGGMGISLSTDAPDHLFKFNYCWFIQDPSGSSDEIHIFYSEADGSNAVSIVYSYSSGSIYSIKCVSDAVSFYKDHILVHATTAAYDFDSSVNTVARFCVGQGQVAPTVITATGASQLATNNFDEIVLLKRYQKMIGSNLPKSIRRQTPYLLGIYDNVKGKIVLMKVNLVSLNQDGTIKESDIGKIITKAQKKIITDKFPNLEGRKIG